ncbi:uncharacterized protein LODBEIA_P25010 [Lodderomyces beijingensis]|uniref:Uncharacterized protein n=1 Tax=Lodderomyces beijingensis TaxID=1775926 RepID=A0ABP0ZJF9_9ASCO
MGLLDLLGSSGSACTTIPTFDESKDSIDLQIKSLLYIFKRLCIHKVTPLTKEGKLRHVDAFEMQHDPMSDKLDRTYNLDFFLTSVLLDDEHRVLVDFVKNKFRSLCFVSGLPCISRPSSPVKGESANRDGSLSSFPQFTDSHGRKASSFHFVLFPMENVTVEELVHLLSTSELYLEHSVPFIKRFNIASETAKKVFGAQSADPQEVLNVTPRQKQRLIYGYLTALAKHVQVMRIYEEYTKLHPLVYSDSQKPALQHSPSQHSLKSLKSNEAGTKRHGNTPPLSPTRLHSSPTKLAHKRSSTNMLKPKPSIPKLQLEELYNPLTSPPRPASPIRKVASKSESSDSENNKSGSLTLSEGGKEILRLDVYEKCKIAVQDKIGAESKKILAGRGSS